MVRMPNPPRTAISMSLTAGALATLAVAAVPAARCLAQPPSPPRATPRESSDDEVARLRAQGPAALEPLLVRWDHSRPGPDRDALEHTIDRVAAQRYATISRMY